MASRAPGNTLLEFRVYASLGRAQLHHAREVAVLVVWVNVVWIDGTDVGVPAVRATTAFPVIDQTAQACPRPAEIFSSNPLVPTLARFTHKRPVLRALPTLLVPEVITLLLSRQLTLLGLSLQADPGQPAVSPCLPVER